ncbi:MAG: hypothetical protein RBR86_01305 [Pseudobdellovibrionaceae bacterium]|jgi:hypothetical protein|nr:hypothetical protein [Pseudobdellovibrionaceae bacterium]
MDGVLRMNISEKCIENLSARVNRLKELHDLFCADPVHAAEDQKFTNFMRDEQARLARESKVGDVSSILGRRVAAYAQLIDAQLEAGQILEKRIGVLCGAFNYYAHGILGGKVSSAVQDLETQYQDLSTRFTLAHAYQEWIKKFEFSGSSVGISMSKTVEELFDIYSEANLSRSSARMVVEAGEYLMPISDEDKSGFVRDFLDATQALALSNFYLSDYECRLGEVLLSDIEMIRQSMYQEYTEKALAVSGARDVMQYELDGVILALQRAQGHLVLGHKYQDVSDRVGKLEHLHL